MGKVMLLSVRIFGAWCLWWVVLLISPTNWEFVTRCCELFDELLAVYWSWCAFFWGVKSCYDIFMMCGSWGSEFGKVGKTCIKHGESMVNPWWIHGESMVNPWWLLHLVCACPQGHPEIPCAAAQGLGDPKLKPTQSCSLFNCATREPEKQQHIHKIEII